MFSHLKGVIDDLQKDGLVIDVSNVGYFVFVSRKTLETVKIGAEVKIYTEPHIREDHIHLYGFISFVEREWFRFLTGVQGVGAKVCLAILSVLGPEQINSALMAQDKNAFALADGVGPKLAGRIINELKDKMASYPVSGNEIPFNRAADQAASASSSDRQEIEDAVSALVNLGYQKFQAHGVIAKIYQTDGPLDLNEYIRRALQELAA